MNKQFDGGRVTHKRSSSPLPDYNSKKKATLSTLYERFNGVTPENISEVLQRVLAKQVELAEQLVFKDAECQKLKRKFDEVDRNCRRWHDFAVGLQTRVKRLALILHRQQDSVKTLQNKEIIAKMDTEMKQQKVISDVLQPDLSAQQKDDKDKLDLKNDKMSNIKQEIQAKSEVSSPAVVIDLTDEETARTNPTSTTNNPSFKHLPSITKQAMTAKQAVMNSGGMENSSNPVNRVIHHTANTCLVNNSTKPLTPVQPMRSSLTNSNFCSRNHIVSSSTSSKHLKTAINSDHITSVKQQQLLLQKNGIHAPVMKTPNGAPYPPLPQVPITPLNSQKVTLPEPKPPLLRIKKIKDGMELSWDHAGVSRVKIDSYELYVYQHNPNSSSGNRWKKIGNDSIKAMPLPMACTLSQFSTGSKYYFAVRGKDVYGRYGAFSLPCCSADVQ